MFKTRFNFILILVFIFFSSQNNFSQCFEIESVLVDACDTGTNEGLNEMVRFKVGSVNVNTSTMSVTWPSNTWRNLIQDAATATNVALMNAQIIAAGGCGRIIEPIGGVLPANSAVILVTSNNFSPLLNVFGAITQNIYILFQNNPTNSSGHFANYNATSGLRTLSISFGGSCTDSVAYDRSMLLNINGTYGPAFPNPNADALNNGSTVNFASNGTATYVNNGCLAPVQVFSVDAGTTPIAACPSATLSLRGNAQGQQSVLWSATSGSFSNPSSLITNYSLANGVTGSVTITLTATNLASCTVDITDTVIINIGAIATPIIDSVVQPTCTTATGSVTLSGLPTGNWTLNPGGILGSTTTATILELASGTANYTVTNAAGCISSASANVVIDAQPITPIAPIIDSVVQPTCTSSTGSVTLSGLPAGNWILNPGGILGSTTTATILGLASVTTNYTVTNAAGCISSASANVVINLAPTTSAPVFSPIQPICIGTILTLPLISNNGVSGTWSPLFDSTTSTKYTFTPDPGQCSSVTTLKILVIPSPIVTASPATETICSLQTTGILLSSLNTETTFSWTVLQTGATGASNDSGNIISQVLTSTGSNIGSAVYSITPTYIGCIGSPISVTIFITPKPILTITNTSLSICSGNATEIIMASSMPNTTYSWNVIQTNVTGANTGNGNAINQIIATIGNSSGEVVYGITPNVNGCPGATVLATIAVNPIPTLTINPVLGQEICSGTSTNISLSSAVSGTTFNWTENSTNTTGASAATGNSIAQIITAITPDAAMVVYTIIPTSNGCVGPSDTVTVIVKPIPLVTSPSVSGEIICSGNGINIALTGSFIDTVINWTVSQNGVSGATNGAGSTITDILNTTSNNSGTAIYSVQSILNSCSGLPLLISVVVNTIPKPTLAEGILCVEESGNIISTFLLDSGLSENDHSFQWFLEGILQPATGTTFEAFITGNYSVIATDNVTGCASLLDSAIVSGSNPATNFTAVVTSNYFSENATITALASGGNGTYQFSLDYGSFQTSTIFENVAPGQHIISINDTNGCTNLLPVTLTIIGNPNYFTPNGDGINDYWNIIGLENQPAAKVYIFDRYGKMIKQISTKSAGWDGTYNGNPMPSTDYWFTIQYFETALKEYKSHFTLKR